ncbi:MAG: YdhR family protein [Rhodospirillales bacterium]|nr:YdhR family protein [Rhodospirillales bacterium]
MVIVQINYRRPDMPKAQWDARYTEATAAPFVSLPGLEWKIWLDDPTDAQLSGGIYLFADRAAAEAYVNGPIVASMRANTTLRALDIRIFDVRRNMSELTRAPILPLPLAAQ